MDVVREALVFKVVVLSCGCIGFGWEDRDILPDPFLQPNPSPERFSCPGKKNCSSWHAKRSNTETYLFSKLVLENIIRICIKLYPDQCLLTLRYVSIFFMHVVRSVNFN